MQRVPTTGTVRTTRRPKNELAIFLVLFGLVTLIWLPRLRGPIDLRWDGSVYYILGTSLAEGKGYKLLNEPGDIDATQYPPLLPALIAAHQWLMGTSDHLIVGQGLRLTFFSLFMIYILAIYLMIRNYLPIKYALPATLFCLFNLHTYFMSDLCFPEVPFALITILFVLCNRKDGRRIYSILATVLAIASYALRTVGIALLAAWIGESLFNREFKRAAVRLMVSLIPVFCWQSYTFYIESGPQYKDPVYAYQRADYMFYNVSYGKNVFKLKDSFSPELGYASFGDIANRFLGNLMRLPISMGEAISSKASFWEWQWLEFNRRLPFSLAGPWVATFTLLILGCLILGGIGLQLMRRQWIIPVYVLLSLAAICLTPWPGEFNRYLMPLAPFLALSFFQLLLTLKDQSRNILSSKWKVAASAAMGVVVFLILLQQFFAGFQVYKKWHQKVVYQDRNGKSVAYRLFFYSDSYQALDAATDWLQKRANPSEVVAVSMPHWVYLRTGLKTVMPPFEPNSLEAQTLLDSVPVTYLIVDEGLAVETKEYTIPVIESFPNRWRRVYSDSVVTESGEVPRTRFEIYKRVGERRDIFPTSSKAYPKYAEEAGMSLGGDEILLELLEIPERPEFKIPMAKR